MPEGLGFNRVWGSGPQSFAPVKSLSRLGTGGAGSTCHGYLCASWKRILNPGFQDGSRLNPKYVPRARDFCVIELIPLPFQICHRIFQRVTSDSIKCNGSFVRSLYGRICRGGHGGGARSRVIVGG